DSAPAIIGPRIRRGHSSGRGHTGPSGRPRPRGRPQPHPSSTGWCASMTGPDRTSAGSQGPLPPPPPRGSRGTGTSPAPAGRPGPVDELPGEATLALRRTLIRRSVVAASVIQVLLLPRPDVIEPQGW